MKKPKLPTFQVFRFLRNLTNKIYRFFKMGLDSPGCWL